MSWRDSEDAWGWISITLHWAVVLLVLSGALLGLFMTEMSLSAAKVRVYALHKSIGITVLALMLLRVAWRLASRRPRALPAPRWQNGVAATTHWMLYAAALALPLSGWLYNSASNFPLQWFGLFNLPAIAERDAGLKELAHDLHYLLFWCLVVLVVVHAGAALWHHLVRRDRTLSRMLPWLKPAVPTPVQSSQPESGQGVR